MNPLGSHITRHQAYIEVGLGAEIQNSTLQFLHEANPVNGQFRVVLPIEQTIQVCRHELELAQFNVTQLGQRRLLGCKHGDATCYVELTLERSNSSYTDVVCVLHG